MTDPRPALLLPDEVAERLNLNARTLANWRSRGEGPPYLKLGGCVRYDPLDLEAWIEAQRCATSGRDAA